MKTIIELYDERPIENVLGAEVFRPKELVILCPAEVESTNVLAKSLRKYFEHRGCPIKVTVVPVSLLDARKVEKQLRPPAHGLVALRQGLVGGLVPGEDPVGQLVQGRALGSEIQGGDDEQKQQKEHRAHGECPSDLYEHSFWASFFGMSFTFAPHRALSCRRREPSPRY